MANDRLVGSVACLMGHHSWRFKAPITNADDTSIPVGVVRHRKRCSKCGQESFYDAVELVNITRRRRRD